MPSNVDKGNPNSVTAIAENTPSSQSKSYTSER